MSQVTYAAFTARMIEKYEGPYGWTKGDRGGPTKYGITCYDLAEHMGQKMDSMTRWAPIVKAMTLATAEEIYATKYATYIDYNDLPPGVDACMDDYAINSGIGRPMLVSRSLLKIKASSVKMDQVTLDAIKKVDPVHFVNAMCDERLSFMHAIRGGVDWREFGGGWSARVADLRAYCTHLAQGGSVAAAPPAADLSKIATPKAVHPDPKTAGTATAGAVVAAGGAAVAAGLNWWEVGGAVVAVIIGGVVYEAYEANKTAKANAVVVIPASAAKLVVPAPAPAPVPAAAAVTAAIATEAAKPKV